MRQRTFTLEGHRTALRNWLKKHGGELLPNNGKYELARWRLKGALGIAYRDQFGVMRFNCQEAGRQIEAFDARKKP